MNQSLPPILSFAMLFNPATALAASKRVVQWDLPRHICRPLDRCGITLVSADLAAYDAAAESTIDPKEGLGNGPLSAVCGKSSIHHPALDFDRYWRSVEFTGALLLRDFGLLDRA